MKYAAVPPSVDMAKTGEKIRQLRLEAGYTVRDLQEYFMFENPQAIYKWQEGRNLPSIDNLYALSVLLNVSMDEIIVPAGMPEYEERGHKDPAHCFYALLFTAPGGKGTVEAEALSDPVALNNKLCHEEAFFGMDIHDFRRQPAGALINPWVDRQVDNRAGFDLLFIYHSYSPFYARSSHHTNAGEYTPAGAVCH